MKLLDNFIKTWNGRYIEVYDSNARNQCVDLILKWIQEIGLGHIIPLGVSSAYQLYSSPSQRIRDNFTIHKNTVTAIPQPGDIIVWSSKYGPSGHTAICVFATQYEITTFSQNDPLGVPCVIKKYNYDNVSGWLRPKLSIPEPQEPTQPMPDTKLIPDSYRLDWKEVATGAGEDENDPKFDDYKAIDQLVDKRVKEWVNICNKDLKEAEIENMGLIVEKKSLEATNQALPNINNELKKKLAECNVEQQNGNIVITFIKYLKKIWQDS